MSTRMRNIADDCWDMSCSTSDKTKKLACLKAKRDDICKCCMTSGGVHGNCNVLIPGYGLDFVCDPPSNALKNATANKLDVSTHGVNMASVALVISILFVLALCWFSITDYKKYRNLDLAGSVWSDLRKVL